MSAFIFQLLAACDFLTGAALTPALPALMWALCGLVLGACLAFWLEAPVYGLRQVRPWIIAGPFLLLGVGACVVYPMRPSPSLAAPAAPPPAPVPAPNFGGSWETEKWGAMSLVQDGQHVFGTYVYANGVIEGTVSPGANGTSILRYRWRNQERSGSGVGYFALAAGAQSFEGRWTVGENLPAGSGQDWSGKRTAAAPPPPTFTGVWDTEWGEMRLNQGVTQVTGTYRYGGGLIRGEVEGKRLRFRWVNRVTGESGAGQFTLALYGNSFRGTWGSGSSSTSGEAWTGRRLQATP